MYYQQGLWHITRMGDIAEKGVIFGPMHEGILQRSIWQRIIDTITFPLRAFLLIERNALGMSSLATDRYDYVAANVEGRCLDFGCGKHNTFVVKFLGGNGKGVDIYPYAGLTEEHIIEDPTKLPFTDGEFDTVTFIANMNHIPESIRDLELNEAIRVTKPGGRVVVTMGHPLAEILTHKVVWFYDKVLGTKFDMDNQRGMDPEESLYISDREIIDRLQRTGYTNIKRKMFTTQWGLNHLFVGHKPL